MIKVTKETNKIKFIIEYDIIKFRELPWKEVVKIVTDDIKFLEDRAINLIKDSLATI